MARPGLNNNPLGINQFTGFGRSGFGVTISSKGWARLAAQFGAEVRRADVPIRTAWHELAADVQIRASQVLREEIARHGRPQRDQRGERRRLQYVLAYEPTENLSIIRVHGMQFPNVKALDNSPAGRYWRQVENPDGRHFTMSGLFVLPPIGGGRWNNRQWQKPGEARDAVKFQQFAGPSARTIHAHLGPASGGYHFLQRAGEDERRQWRKGKAKRVFLGEFRAHGLDLLARILARREFDASQGRSYEAPRFFS